MPYNYIPYCTECGTEGESDSLASEKNSHGDFLIQTRCSGCGNPISVIKAEFHPERKYRYNTDVLKTEAHFMQLSPDELISEMKQLGSTYYQWEADKESQGDVDPELLQAVGRCIQEIRRRILTVTPQFVKTRELEVLNDGGEPPLSAPAEREARKD